MKNQRQKLEIRRNRFFSVEFKKNKVKELINKRITIKEISNLYGVSREAVYQWLYKYSKEHERKPNFVVQMDSEAQRTKYLLERLAELERIIGQKQLEIDFLNKLLELGSEDLGFDLKKNFSAKLSSGTGSTPDHTNSK